MKDVRIWVKDAGLLLKAEKTVIIEGGRRRPWPSGKWSYHLCRMEEPAHLKQFHWKSCVALWDNWICGRLSEEPKCCSSFFTFNDFDYFSIKTSVMWGFASLAMKKKKSSTSLEKKITSLQVSNHKHLSRKTSTMVPPTGESCWYLSAWSPPHGHILKLREEL